MRLDVRTIACVVVLAALCAAPGVTEAHGDGVVPRTSAAELDAVPSVPARADSSGRLKWRPPRTAVYFHVQNTGRDQVVTLDNAVDYRVILPGSVMTGKLKIRGGRNITIIGGAFSLQPGRGNASLVFYDTDNVHNRTIHVEGVSFDMSHVVGDAIAVAAPTAVFQFQNIRITGLHGTYFDELHSDAIQNWGGARGLRIHRMTVQTDYQGFMIPPTEAAPIGFVTMVEVEQERIGVVHGLTHRFLAAVTAPLADLLDHRAQVDLGVEAGDRLARPHVAVIAGHNQYGVLLHARLPDADEQHLQRMVQRRMA